MSEIKAWNKNGWTEAIEVLAQKVSVSVIAAGGEYAVEGVFLDQSKHQIEVVGMANGEYGVSDVVHLEEITDFEYEGVSDLINLIRGNSFKEYVIAEINSSVRVFKDTVPLRISSFGGKWDRKAFDQAGGNEDQVPETDVLTPFPKEMMIDF